MFVCMYNHTYFPFTVSELHGDGLNCLGFVWLQNLNIASLISCKMFNEIIIASMQDLTSQTRNNHLITLHLGNCSL